MCHHPYESAGEVLRFRTCAKVTISQRPGYFTEATTVCHHFSPAVFTI
jgi:hypothetical protein